MKTQRFAFCFPQWERALKAGDFVLMQSAMAIAEKHTLEQGTHRPCTQSPEKVNLDSSKSNNNESKHMKRLKLDILRNSTVSTQTTTWYIMLQKSEKAQKSIFKARLKAFLGV